MPGDFGSISADRIFEHVQKLSEIGPREDGTAADIRAADYIYATLSELGLDVQREPVPCWVIEPVHTELRMRKPRDWSIECHHGNLTGLTSPDGVTGELVFVEKAFSEHVESLDLTGKIALGYQDDFWETGDKPILKLMRVFERGAIGLIFSHRRRDDIITCWPLGRNVAEIPFVSISFPTFLALRELMKSGPVEVTLKAQGQVKRGNSPNIWTVVRGTELPDEIVGIGGSHHETVPFCPGANDNGAGVSMTLELARFFRDNPQRRSIMLLNNGGEEAGCWGTATFVEQHLDWLKRSLKAMFMVDQMGGSQPVIFAGGTRWVEDIYLEEAKRLGYRLPFSTEKRVVPTPEFIGDPFPFVKVGLPVANIGGWPSDQFYHTEEDTADKVSANGIKAVAEIVASSVMRVASQ